MTNVDTYDSDRAHELAVFTRRFSTLIDIGVNLVRSLYALEQEMAPPFADTIREMRLEIEQGSTLAATMGRRTSVFSAFYTQMINMGEIGGNLEELLSLLADLLGKPWLLNLSDDEVREWAWLVVPGAGSLPRDWSDLSHRQRLALTTFCCRTLGMLLSAGVPLLHAANVTSELLPTNQREQFRTTFHPAIRSGKRIGEALAQMGVKAPFLLQMISIGEEAGNLDIILEKAAQCYERELEMGMR